jgi:hypothetical protein
VRNGKDAEVTSDAAIIALCSSGSSQRWLIFILSVYPMASFPGQGMSLDTDGNRCEPCSERAEATLTPDNASEVVYKKTSEGTRVDFNSGTWVRET